MDWAPDATIYVCKPLIIYVYVYGDSAYAGRSLDPTPGNAEHTTTLASSMPGDA